MYNQINITLMALSTRLATFEDLVMNKLREIETHLKSEQKNTLDPNWDELTEDVTFQMSLDNPSRPFTTPVPIERPAPQLPAPVPVQPPSNLPSSSIFPSAYTPPLPLHFAMSSPASPAALLGLSDAAVSQVKSVANSRKNFSARIAKLVFSENERRVSNCSGKKGKNKLDSTKLGLIRKLTYYEYPLIPGVDEDVDWKNCIRAIDEVNRRK